MAASTRRTLVIIGAVVAAALLVLGGVFLAGTAAVQALLNTKPVETVSETSDTQVVSALTRTEEVSLLSLQVQGIAEKTEKTTFLGIDIPGSERASFLQYSFNAKLGIDGAKVRIEPSGDQRYTISVPAFTFIGHDDVSFKLAAENNGVLSWVTPEIDPLEMSNGVLNSDAQGQYLTANVTALQEQAKAFYTGIAAGIDPGIELEFKFETRAGG